MLPTSALVAATVELTKLLDYITNRISKRGTSHHYHRSPQWLLNTTPQQPGYNCAPPAPVISHPPPPPSHFLPPLWLPSSEVTLLHHYYPPPPPHLPHQHQQLSYNYHHFGMNDQSAHGIWQYSQHHHA